MFRRSGHAPPDQVPLRTASSVKNGDAWKCWSAKPDFLRVRTAASLKKPDEQHFHDQQIYDALGWTGECRRCVLRNESNLHLAPGRDRHLRFAAGAESCVLKRCTAEKQLGSAAAVGQGRRQRGRGENTLSNLHPRPVVGGAGGWWCETRRTAWAGCRPRRSRRPARSCAIRRPPLCRLLRSEPGARPTEGADKKFQVSSSSPKTTRSGLPYDYDGSSLCTWNVRKHRYETAYREHGLNSGPAPVVASKNYNKEGALRSSSCA